MFSQTVFHANEENVLISFLSVNLAEISSETCKDMQLKANIFQICLIFHFMVFMTFSALKYFIFFYITFLKFLVCRMLYDTDIQDQGLPHCQYVPESYRNVALTADTAMEKIRLISPAVHFCILRNLEFFMEDRLGIH